MRQSLRMDRQELSLKLIKSFRKTVGGITAAALLIQADLKCSYSKAEKIAAGRYTCRISAAEQEKLNALMTRAIKTAKASSEPAATNCDEDQVAV